MGLVTRAEFVEKQKTFQEQLAAHQDKRKRDEAEAAAKVCSTQAHLVTSSSILEGCPATPCINCEVRLMAILLHHLLATFTPGSTAASTFLCCALQLKEAKHAKRAKLAAKTTLSFAADEEDEDEVFACNNWCFYAGLCAVMQQLCDVTQLPEYIMHCMLLLLLTGGSVLNDAVAVQIADACQILLNTKRRSPCCSCRAVPCSTWAHSPYLLFMACRCGEL